jgi:hypothetical protein
MVATEVFPLTHVPPVATLLNVDVVPMQGVDEPVIGPKALMVTFTKE